jgi:hypothetical protein
MIGFEGYAAAHDLPASGGKIAVTRTLGFLSLIAVAMVVIAIVAAVVAVIVVAAYMIYTVPRA